MHNNVVATYALAIVSTALAQGIRFTSPAAGASVDAGVFSVEWGDAGGYPAMADLLATHILELFIGGNYDYNMQELISVAAGVFDSPQSATISPSLGPSVKNGYFLRMTSQYKDGSVVNYSPRFSITGMTGTVPANISHAAAGMDAMNYPPTQIEAYPSTDSSTTRTSTSSSATANPTITVTAAGAASSTSKPASGSGVPAGLSTGAKAGTGIAVVAVVLSIAAVVAWLLVRRRKRRVPSEKSNQAYVDGKAELSGEQSEIHRPPFSELGHEGELAEAGSDARPPEADDRHVRAELDGNWYGHEAVSPDTRSIQA